MERPGLELSALVVEKSSPIVIEITAVTIPISRINITITVTHNIS